VCVYVCMCVHVCVCGFLVFLPEMVNKVEYIRIIDRVTRK